ncbi:DNA repair protein RadA [Patescibacteria group bacterium]|nr:DNA repair protein RadA [Patescibacteria group bacterium]
MFECSKCNSQFPKWLGQCPECGSWGTITEELTVNKESNKNRKPLVSFSEIQRKKAKKIETKIEEIDRVLGEGLVPSSLVLLGGQPGIGKSTLALQIIGQFKESPTLYVSGEESSFQIQSRCQRLNIKTNNLDFLGETEIESIAAGLREKKPVLTIIDSIQTIYSADLKGAPGSLSQIRLTLSRLRELAQETKSVILIVGQVTKDGLVAGPKTLEHLVDVILYLEGSPGQQFRFLRSLKNRFGSTQEIGVFNMQEKGLIEVKSPSEFFLANRNLEASGAVVTPVIEGGRSFLVEVQALVSRTSFGYPQRKCSGFELSRLNLLIAVLIQRLKLNLNQQDIHINIVGGLRVKEPAIDLAVCLAIFSAYKNEPFPSHCSVFGEVGLTGEVRGVVFAEKRIKECLKMGLKKIVCPSIVNNDNPKIASVKNLQEAIKVIKGFK